MIVPIQLFLRRELFSRLSIVLTIVCIAPALIVLVAKHFGASGFTFLEETIGPLYLNILTALIAVFHAVSAFHEEFESRTIVYLLTRPPTRASYVLAKFCTAWICTTLSLGIGIVVTTVACAAGTSFSSYWFIISGQLLVSCTLAVGVYSALFLVLGLVVKNPVLIGLVFSLGWENIVGSLPGTAPYYSVGIYPRSFFVKWSGVDPTSYTSLKSSSDPSMFGPAPLAKKVLDAQQQQLELPGMWTSSAVMVFATVIMLICAVYLFQRKEDA